MSREHDAARGSDAGLANLAQAARATLRGFSDRDAVLPLALSLWLALSIGNYVAGAVLVFALAYLVPIAIAAVWSGRRAGIALGALSAVSAVIAWSSAPLP